MKERFNKDILYISFGALLIPKVMNENKDSWNENIFYKVLWISQIWFTKDTLNKNRINLLGS